MQFHYMQIYWQRMCTSEHTVFIPPSLSHSHTHSSFDELNPLLLQSLRRKVEVCVLNDWPICAEKQILSFA